VTRAGIDAFADATNDHQWIHVDPERARDTPFGGTIAHGFYTLSLAPHFMEELLHVDGVALMINYGLNTELTFERAGGKKPVCVAESLSRAYAG
jgi:acyl dehydratase